MKNVLHLLNQKYSIYRVMSDLMGERIQEGNRNPDLLHDYPIMKQEADEYERAIKTLEQLK